MFNDYDQSGLNGNDGDDDDDEMDPLEWRMLATCFECRYLGWSFEDGLGLKLLNE